MPPMPNVGAGNSIRPDGHLKGDRGEFEIPTRGLNEGITLEE